MQEYSDFITGLEGLAHLANSVNSLKPIPTFLLKKRAIIKLRALTQTQRQFRSLLQEVILEPGPEEAFYDLCDLYAKALPEQRKEIRDNWDYKRVWQLPDQTTLACDIDTEHSPEERIRASLIYTSLMKTDDYRDMLIWLAPIYHSARLAGMDAEAVIREVSDILSPVAASLMDSFINRRAEGKSLGAWCLREVVTDNGTKLIHS